jgi:transcriptional regulator with PAS, ATPase and Fis domain
MCSQKKVINENEKTLKEYEIEIISHYLSKYENNVLKVSEILDIGKSKIYTMIKSGEIVLK